ncbi:carboxypeptidase-like regulatory domain-containing protein [Pedobacter sp. PAMC26386]|nr:carboxypeptidase-like regulatory domain-containing protein [Pedobacter sp. PAMC26386]
MKKILTSLLLLLLSTVAFAQQFTLKGVTTDKQNNILPFTSIFIQGTSNGTSANTNGEFQLKLNKGRYTLVFKAVGYNQLIKEIEINADLSLPVVMQAEVYQLKDVVIKANAEDPAYEIIRNAIKKRKQHLTEVKDYSCNTYIKGVTKLKNAPKKILGRNIQDDLKNIGLDSGKRGILYLSESVSKFNFQQPGKINEEMISSKVSGNSNGFSFNQATDFMISFYKNTVDINELSRVGFISPIADQAMLFYRYEFIGTFREGSDWINKIQVISRRKYDQVFNGYIYITDDTWRIHSTDLTITNNSMIEGIDTLHIKQQFIPVKNNKWMLASQRYDYSGGLLGFKFMGTYTGVFTNYNIEPNFPPKFFSNRVLKINADANKKDSTYWTGIRPMLLTPEERRDYVRKDSIKLIHGSDQYQDSIDRKANKFKPLKVLTLGYTHQKTKLKEYWGINSPLLSVNYNTVEGWIYSPKLSYRKILKDSTSLIMQLNPRYGFENKKLSANATLAYRYDPKHSGNIGIQGGTSYTDFNSEFTAIPPLFNTISTLFYKDNILKLYKKDFVNIYSGRELSNGLYLSGNLEYVNRTPLLNTSFRTVKDFPNKEFTANNPYPSTGNDYAFIANKALTLGLTLNITFAQTYIERPDFNIRQGSQYPKLQLNYRKGIKGLLNSDVDFDYLGARVYDSNKKLGILGAFKYSMATGKFINRNKMYYMDYKHFAGSDIVIYTQFADGFMLLSPYEFSTGKEFLEAHFEHNFGGLFLSKIPLFKKLKLEEVIGVNYLTSDVIKNYTEAFVGIQRFGLRLNLVKAFNYDNLSKMSGSRSTTGFRISAGF